ncbi:DNA-processing protein DprA [Qingrenia yutianensis]|uniref:DNA-protecting protein DprA n=1 Tax=Qingrenia yutianensis TaxID=2763676 RepID=A0A926IRF7_9FIRM|nr:DNA-processing protein DprA [Qingrenia yutianensis]MBC8595364.1 DNA-protecting protein DprA [Qingrenia yutianensis]MBC8595366.1 DNA-protecting protein DprA [Qingrenia yutianensis]
MTNVDKWLWLTVKCGIRRAKIKVMLDEVFVNIDALYDASESDYGKFKFLNAEEKSRLCDKSVDGIDKFLNTLAQYNVRILTSDNEAYPYLLKETADYPYVLYCRGRNFINLNDYLCISLVGSRKATQYGLNVARSLANDLAKNGALVVSGMADGIDSAAHLGALDAKAPTVAVLGCGINRVYPASNAYLMKRIMETGMVMTEYPPNSEPMKHHFPERNRIISGICSGTVVVEATFKSGSLITASLANEAGREVYAIPGNINSLNSKGTNQLLKDGALLATNADDIIVNYASKDEFKEKIARAIVNLEEKESKMRFAPDSDFNSDENAENQAFAEENGTAVVKELSVSEKVLSVINGEPMHIDKISALTGISVSDLSVPLLELELNGKIISQAGDLYTLAI